MTVFPDAEARRDLRRWAGRRGLHLEAALQAGIAAGWLEDVEVKYDSMMVGIGYGRVRDYWLTLRLTLGGADLYLMLQRAKNKKHYRAYLHRPTACCGDEPIPHSLLTAELYCGKCWKPADAPLPMRLQSNEAFWLDRMALDAFLSDADDPLTASLLTEDLADLLGHCHALLSLKPRVWSTRSQQVLT